MLDSRLRFLTTRHQDPTDDLTKLESTGRFGLAVAGVPRPRVRVLAQVGDLTDEDLAAGGLVVSTRAGDIVAGDIALDDIAGLAALPGVTLVEGARPLHHELDASVPDTGATALHEGPRTIRGAGVVVGIVDTGIDWRHGSFRDGAGNSRILRIWEQNVRATGDERAPQPYGYGVEYDTAAIETALLADDPFAVVRSVDDPGGHGTHVCGIAAGDGSASAHGEPAFIFIGMAPEADIVFVANKVTTESMGDSATTLDAISYIFDVAGKLGRPAVINLSQGDNLGSHDGTSLLERGIDNLLGGPGRAVVKSAGNSAGAGMHASGRGTATVGFEVPPADSTPDTLDFWYTGDGMTVAVTTPDGTSSETVPAGTTTTLRLANGNQVFIDSVTAHPLNGASRIYVQLLPGGAETIAHGRWAITLTGAGDWHGWIEGGTAVPQFVGEHRNDEVTITVPGNSAEIITVGSYITRGEPVGGLSAFSSLGPTRDGRPAPTLTAPGEEIFSANAGADDDDGPQYVGYSGTSMAAPHVTGAVALLLQESPKLTQREIADRLTREARSDESAGAAPRAGWGAGKLDVGKLGC